MGNDVRSSLRASSPRQTELEGNRVSLNGEASFAELRCSKTNFVLGRSGTLDSTRQAEAGKGFAPILWQIGIESLFLGGNGKDHGRAVTIIRSGAARAKKEHEPQC